MLIVDRREKDLIHALADVPHEVRELPVGDVVCEYGAGDGAWDVWPHPQGRRPSNAEADHIYRKVEVK